MEEIACVLGQRLESGCRCKNFRSDRKVRRQEHSVTSGEWTKLRGWQSILQPAESTDCRAELKRRLASVEDERQQERVEVAGAVRRLC